MGDKMKGVVSIVSSCYNGESYLNRYFDAILAQTYRPLQLIIVNDGSTDRSEEIILSYKEKLLASNIDFEYVHKENEGIGSAVNDGLKYATGDYLIWPDTDDFLMPESIEKRVKFLEENSEYGFAVSDGQTYLEGRLEKKGVIKAIVTKNGDMFDNIVSSNVIYTPCGWMIRMSAFLDVNPNKEIFPSRYGQNIQMLLPVSYKYKCGHVKEVLYGRVDRPSSLSKQVWKGDGAWKNRILGLEEIYVQTLKSIGGDALAYIPYIYYRNLRILGAISKKIDKQSMKEQQKVLTKSTKLLAREMFKYLIKK